MPLNTKTIKRRIKSISSTKKITKAMEMISAVKMRRAVANVLATRNYAELAWEMLQEIATKTDVSHHALLGKREVKKIGLILITSNRGLAGGFSSRLLQEVHNFIKNTTNNAVIPTESQGDERRNPLTNQSQGSRDSSAPLRSARNDNNDVQVEIILTGRKGKKIYQRFGHTVVAEFDKLDLTTKIDEILPMAQLATAEYITGKYDKIVVAYMDFVSAINQVPKLKQLLPLQQEASGNSLPAAGWELAEASDRGGLATERSHPPLPRPSGELSEYGYGFTFEPNTTEVLEVLLPRLVEMQMYQAILESDASEHSARMLAMRNASDAASDMIKELNYSFNKARQAAITQEISEIVGGAVALG